MQDAAWTTDDLLAEAQVWVRRLACICFAVMIVAEVITGKVRLPVSLSPRERMLCVLHGTGSLCSLNISPALCMIATAWQNMEGPGA